MMPKRDAVAFLAVTAFAVTARVLFVSFVRPVPVNDFAWYYEHAVQIAAGSGYTTHGLPTAYWPPGWPYFLAAIFSLFGAHVYAGELAQAVLGGLTAGLVFLIAYRLGGRTCAIAAGLIYACLPSAVEWTATLASEPLYTFLVMLATCLWVWLSPAQLGWFALSGAVIGAASLVRPTALFMWGVLFVFLWFSAKKRRLRRAVLPAIVVLLCAGVTIAPDLVRNYRIFHAFVLIANTGGLTLWTGNNPNFFPGDAIVRPLQLKKMSGDPRTELRADELAAQMATSYIREHPRETAARAIPKLRALYATDDGPIKYAFETNDSTTRGRAVKWVNRTFYYLVLLCALAGVVLSIRTSRAAHGLPAVAVLLLTAIAYYTLPFTILPAYDRYHFPIMPYYAVFAGLAVASLVQQPWRMHVRALRAARTVEP